MRFVRIFTEAYRLLTSEDTTRLGQAAIQAAMNVLWGTRLVDENGAVPNSAVFLGGGWRPVATGAANTLTLKAGLALRYDSSEADQWIGQVKPLLLNADTTVNIPTNSDSSGDDRVDIVVVTPTFADGDTKSGYFGTPGAPLGTGVYQKNTSHERVSGYTIEVIEGTPAASPTVPATPSGSVKICEISRINGVADVNAADVTDRRFGDILRLGRQLHILGENADIKLGGLNTNHAGLRFFDEAEGNFEAGEVGFYDQTFDDTNPSGSVAAWVLRVFENLVTKGQSIQASAIFTHPGGTPTAPYDYTLAASKNITSISYEGGSEMLLEVTFDASNRPRSNNYAVIATVACDAGSSTPLGHFVGSGLDNTTAYLQYIDASGNLAEPPAVATSAGGTFSVAIIDLTDLYTP